MNTLSNSASHMFLLAFTYLRKVGMIVEIEGMEDGPSQVKCFIPEKS